MSGTFSQIASMESLSLRPGEFGSRINKNLEHWKNNKMVERIWQKDPAVWDDKNPSDITDRLGWLDLPTNMFDRLEEIESFVKSIQGNDFEYALLLGMGGSSLAADTFQRTFASEPGFPELMVLDSTHPRAIRKKQKSVELENTLFLVASKSGTTLETRSLFSYFWSLVKEKVSHPGNHFVAITDPGTPLDSLARERNFRTVFHAPTDVGGRYSALSEFGMVPASLIGVNVEKLLTKARLELESSDPAGEIEENAAVRLGAFLGTVTIGGRDKITLLTPPELRSFSDWLEQLIAESTGKDGRGMIPIVGEKLRSPGNYPDDRQFVVFTMDSDAQGTLPSTVSDLEEAGHPVVSIRLSSLFDIGREMFRWEMAVATAGIVLGIDPFSQPDVEETKVITRQAMENVNSRELGEVSTVQVENKEILSKRLKTFLSDTGEGDYICVQAFLSPEKNIKLILQSIREQLSRSANCATTLGFGPRFLHSTGQMHKGGPNNGLFLQIVDKPEECIFVPGEEYKFSELIDAQSKGDYLALRRRNREVIRIDVGACPEEGLDTLSDTIEVLGFAD